MARGISLRSDYNGDDLRSLARSSRDAKQARRLFRPFSKSADEAATTAPGVGLGLALCRRLAKSMGGTLQLDGKQTGEGACFTLKLPICDA